jgi:hypothetical protein
MIVRIKKANHDIIIIHKFPIIHDARLSLKAKGLLTYLCGHSDSWEARVDDIAAHCRDGRESVITGLKELQEHGYAVKTLIRNSKGQIVDTHWTINELPPEYPKTPESENPITVSPESGNPITDIPGETPANKGNSPESGKPKAENPTLRSTKIRIRSNILIDPDRENLKISAPPIPDPLVPDYASLAQAIGGQKHETISPQKKNYDKLVVFPSEQESLRRQELLRQAQILNGA